jgi:hypothetical protein
LVLLEQTRSFELPTCTALKHSACTEQQEHCKLHLEEGWSSSCTGTPTSEVSIPTSQLLVTHSRPFSLEFLVDKLKCRRCRAHPIRIRTRSISTTIENTASTPILRRSQAKTRCVATQNPGTVNLKNRLYTTPRLQWRNPRNALILNGCPTRQLRTTLLTTRTGSCPC